MDTTDIQKLIETGLPGARAYITGDGTHFEALVVCAAFAGKRMLEQHRMVYATLGDRMQGAIHALSIRSFTPEEWARAGHAEST